MSLLFICINQEETLQILHGKSFEHDIFMSSCFKFSVIKLYDLYDSGMCCPVASHGFGPHEV